MKNIYRLFVFVLFNFAVYNGVVYASHNVPADDPYIQYYGRWDFTDPKAPTHSWPGTYVYAEFEGTSIGIQTNDNACWYNVFLDGDFKFVFHGTKNGVASYNLFSGLPDGHHTILFKKRSETSWTKFSFNGLILDDGKNLLAPPEKPAKKIEFIGDSYTSAAGNEWTNNDAAPSDSLTNLDKGFGPLVAKHFGAQYMMSSRGGIGMVHDWQDDYANNMPDFYDRALFSAPNPKWDFTKWIPNLVVICLGLNDFSGWNGYSSTIPAKNSDIFRKRYHDFIDTVLNVYPGVNILCVAANNLDWIKNNVSQVVAEENAKGYSNIHYTFFPHYLPDVNGGHPSVASHEKIANDLIGAIDSINAWTPFIEKVPPVFTSLPDEPAFATSLNYQLQVETDTYAKVRYSAQDKPYAQMENDFTYTGTRDHSVFIPCEQGKAYTLYLRAIDLYGNEIDSSTVIHFTVDTTKTYLNWKSKDYNHSSWSSGMAPLGSDGPVNNLTEINPGITSYFIHEFTVDDISTIANMKVYITAHDGVVAYLNGKLISTLNMHTSPNYTYENLAFKPDTLNDSLTIGLVTGIKSLQNGKNIIAFEIHSAYYPTPNISFDAKIKDNTGKIYVDYQDSWYYYDGEKVPPAQLIDKTTGIMEYNNIPGEIFLYPNFPNPFNPETNISFNLNKESQVQLLVFNILGQQVASLVNDKLHAGNYTFKFDGKSLSSGIYFYQLKTDNYNKVRKMTLIK